MVREIRIYFEGDASLRPGFNSFFADLRAAAWERRRIRIRLVAGMGRVVRGFINALAEYPAPDTLNVLLMDSEGPDNGQLRQQLERRSDWRPPRGSSVSDEQIHWMVQVMEAWFLADRDALRDYYGQQFNTQRLPGQPTAVESIPKDDVLRGLTRATERTRKGRYHKTRDAPELLATIDVGKVRQAAPACARLFATLERVL